MKTRLFRQSPRLALATILVLLAAAVSTYCARPQSHDTALDQAAEPAQAHRYRSLADGRSSPTGDPNTAQNDQNTMPGTLKTAPQRDQIAENSENAQTSAANSTRAAGRLRPADHTAEWMTRHGAVARSRADDCMSCHQEEDCMTCHTTDLSDFFTVHPPNFAVAHAIDAQLDTQNCTTCHQVETFCTECHMRAGVSAMEDFAPPPHADFHPPGWLDPSQPNNHGVRARRDITDCASCHREDDCVACHASINPHPAEFRLNCRTWLNADARACAQCHGGELDALRTMCM